MNLTNTYPSLNGKTVVITGGASGIGANLVEAFCRQHARVVFLDRDEEKATKLLSLFEGMGEFPLPRFYACDLIDIHQLQEVLNDIIERFDGIDVLVNNAANDDRHDFRDVTLEYWDERIAINLRHYFFAAQSVYETMKSKGGGSIINFGSMSWYATHGGMPGYTSSKAAIEGMTRGLARDMGSDNIRVNTLVPGWVLTERQLQNSLSDESARESVKESQCIKEFVIPEHIAAMALFLASDDSRMCTSQHFIVDGGII
ncbi:SDR family oxidoreductase [Alteromonas sp. KUL49]|uniref:SDR family NAD(P)-dependent oxidoreductase n=1 Tax=Alteromonas sp. KUL49 TaxID=2480798 RepID=UPI00102EE719|nr:SDR family oxidoreductase [Alteromonas sp. KUL49]TAP39423.1 SDR family oxidoreductase [Alteromonas sp. KUL49]GEA12220.1 3-oxoacyl-ACP reductase [Alteromonas sp. KUL49]